MNILVLLRTFITPTDYAHALAISLSAFAISVLETLCLSAIMPFIMIAMGQRIGPAELFISKLNTYLSFLPKSPTIIFFGVVLTIAFLLRAAASMLFTRYLYRFSQRKFTTVAQAGFSNYLNSTYRDYLHWNSAAVLKMVTNDPFHIGLIIASLLLAVAELFVILTMYVMLLWVNWKVTVGGTLVLGFFSWIAMRPLFNRIKQYGEQNGIFLRQLTRVFNEGFGNYKMIRLTHKTDLFLKRFTQASESFSMTHASYSISQMVPRIILETLVFAVLILGILMLVVLYGEQRSGFILSTMSFYAAAFYRLVPAVNRLVTQYGQISFSINCIGRYESQLLQGMQAESSARNPISFEGSVRAHSLYFAYSKDNYVLSNFDLTIARGDRIGIIGKSGAGKSTFIDILLGLHEPTGGCLIVDDVILTKEHLYSWQQKIGYIPQHIYLFEGSVGDNVVFGRAYDEAWLIHCLIKAQIYGFLQTQDGLQTRVGEGGGQLSGGQRQRIALARALYGNPEILILDEATSGLDKETETLVYQDLFEVAGDKTLIIVSHRTEMLAQCDRIYEIKDGKAYFSGGKKFVVMPDTVRERLL